MDRSPAPFVPPAPKPRTQPPSMLEMMRIVYRNPLELWGEPSYNEPYISVKGAGGPLVIANDPALIRHVLVDNAKNYKMATVRQRRLWAGSTAARPIRTTGRVVRPVCSRRGKNRRAVAEGAGRAVGAGGTGGAEGTGGAAVCSATRSTSPAS